MKKKFQKTLILANLLHYYSIFIVLCDGGNLSQKCVIAWTLKSTHLSWKKRKGRLIFTDNLRKIVVVLQSPCYYVKVSKHIDPSVERPMTGALNRSHQIIFHNLAEDLLNTVSPKHLKIMFTHFYFYFWYSYLLKSVLKQDFDWQVFDRWHFASIFFLTDYWNFLNSNQFQKVEKLK